MTQSAHPVSPRASAARSRLSGVARALSVSALGALAVAPVAVQAHDTEIRNVVFFLGDGMGPVTTTATRIKYFGEDKEMAMFRLPHAARVRTYSLDAQTTDSAPSMAAYMTGVKSRNDVISMDGDAQAIPYKPGKDAATGVTNAVDTCPATGNGKPVTTLLELAKYHGKATGVVTTARLTHATPAATYAHICHRDAEYAIAAQAVPGGAGYNPALRDGVDVLMGGVSQYWRPFDATSRPRGRPDGRDLVAELSRQGYSVATDLPSLNAVPETDRARVIALFDQAEKQGHMSYDLDRDPAVEPSLAQMTTKALDMLSKRSGGFFLMVEGGRIDHALHGTNAARALADTKALDDAVDAAMKRLEAIDPGLKHTLVVVTADHDHTMAFNGYGKRGTDILGLNVNYETGEPSKDVNGVPYTNLVFGNGSNRADTRVAQSQATVTGKDYLQEVAIRRGAPGSETHGGGDVMVFAAGGTEKTSSRAFRGTVENTRVFDLVKAAAGY